MCSKNLRDGIKSHLQCSVCSRSTNHDDKNIDPHLNDVLAHFFNTASLIAKEIAVKIQNVCKKPSSFRQITFMWLIDYIEARLIFSKVIHVL